MPFLIFDSGGVSALASPSLRTVAQLASFRAAGLFPAIVPAVVLVECLTGDPRRDVNTHRLLSACRILPDVSEALARRAARLRTQAGRGSAVDALVVAVAEIHAAVVLTSDPRDIRALAEHARDVAVESTWRQ
jgi:predicted nucleic acid-binding protein